MKRTIILAHPEARRRALEAVSQAGDGVVVTLADPTRNSEQNAKLHAMLWEIADRVGWAGKARSVETWKRLMCAAWLRAEGHSIELLPALDGHGVDFVYSPTSQLSKAEMSSLIEYVNAWMAERPEFAEESQHG